METLMQVFVGLLASAPFICMVVGAYIYDREREERERRLKDYRESIPWVRG